MVICAFVPFLLTIVLSILLRFTDSDYPFGIFKLFLLFFFSRQNKQRFDKEKQEKEDRMQLVGVM